MKLRKGWLVLIWIVIVGLSILTLISRNNIVLKTWSEAMLFFIPSVFAFTAGMMNIATFSSRNPERKTWLLFTTGAGSLVVAEALRAVLHIIPSLNEISLLSQLPYLFILICFFFLVWGFWHQQGIIETEIGTNLRVLLAVIMLAFFVILIIFALPVFKPASTINLVAKIFTLLFLMGDLFMFSGALAVSIRMWGGTLSKPWFMWSVGTIILVGYHLFYTGIVMQGKNPLEFGTGILLAFGLGFLATSAEWRRSMLE